METTTFSELPGSTSREKWQPPELIELDINEHGAEGLGGGAGGDGTGTAPS